MAKIYRYTPAIQKAFGCNVKAEPWMHCCVLTYGKSTELGLDVWIWDTRVHLGSAFIQTHVNRGSAAQIKKALAEAGPAIDNHEPIVRNEQEEQEYQELAKKCKGQHCMPHDSVDSLNRMLGFGRRSQSLAQSKRRH
jgi:hypothetical protein